MAMSIDSKYIDVDSALSRVGGNIDLFKRLLGKFETSFDMDQFNHAIASQDYKQASEIVHAVKGIAGNLSLMSFFEISSILMDQLRGGNAPEHEKVEIFRDSYIKTLAAIKSYLAQ